MSLDTILWPSEPITVSQDIKSLITRFFQASDSTEPDSGVVFADEFFVKDGVFTTHPSCVFKGHEEIATSRQNNSPLIASRSHQLERVYAANSPATDLIVQGKFTINLKDDQTVVMDFNARIMIVRLDEDQTRFKFLQVWTDPTDMMEAIRKAQEAMSSQI